MRRFTYILLIFLFFIGNSSVLNSQTNHRALSKEQKIEADSLLTLGKKKQEQGNYIESIDLFQKSLEIYTNSKDFKMTGDCNSFIAISFIIRVIILKHWLSLKQAKKITKK